MVFTRDERKGTRCYKIRNLQQSNSSGRCRENAKRNGGGLNIVSAFLHEEPCYPFGAGRIRQIRVEPGIAQSFGAFMRDEVRSQRAMQVADQAADSLLGFRMSVQILDVNDQSLGNSTGRLPAIGNGAKRIRHSERTDIKPREVAR